MADQNPFVKMANGKAHFRFQDLLTLVQLIEQSKEARNTKPKKVKTAKKSEVCHGPKEFESKAHSSES